MNITRQGGHYLLFGMLQYVVDWGVTVGLSHQGLGFELANVVGRVCGAVLGFWLNGRITFAGEDTVVGRRQLLRFVLLWLCTTAASTWALGTIARVASLQWAWLAKGGVELMLAGVSFLVSRHWVYRR